MQYSLRQLAPAWWYSVPPATIISGYTTLRWMRTYWFCLWSLHNGRPIPHCRSNHSLYSTIVKLISHQCESLFHRSCSILGHSSLRLLPIHTQISVKIYTGSLCQLLDQYYEALKCTFFHSFALGGPPHSSKFMWSYSMLRRFIQKSCHV